MLAGLWWEGVDGTFVEPMLWLLSLAERWPPSVFVNNEVQRWVSCDTFPPFIRYAFVKNRLNCVLLSRQSSWHLPPLVGFVFLFSSFSCTRTPEERLWRRKLQIETRHKIYRKSHGHRHHPYYENQRPAIVFNPIPQNDCLVDRRFTETNQTEVIEPSMYRIDLSDVGILRLFTKKANWKVSSSSLTLLRCLAIVSITAGVIDLR